MSLKVGPVLAPGSFTVPAGSSGRSSHTAFHAALMSLAAPAPGQEHGGAFPVEVDMSDCGMLGEARATEFSARARKVSNSVSNAIRSFGRTTPGPKFTARTIRGQNNPLGAIDGCLLVIRLADNAPAAPAAGQTGAGQAPAAPPKPPKPPKK
jgi:hypothetical protein